MKYLVTMALRLNANVGFGTGISETIPTLGRSDLKHYALAKEFIFDSLVKARKKYRGNPYFGYVYAISDDMSYGKFIGWITWDLVGDHPDYKKVYVWVTPKGDKVDRNGHFAVGTKHVLNKDGTLGRRLV